jgi:hypothetical protein
MKMKRILLSAIFIIGCVAGLAASGQAQYLRVPDTVTYLQGTASTGASAAGNGQLVQVKDYGSVSVQVFGSFTGMLIYWESTMDPSATISSGDWRPVKAMSLADSTQATSTTASGAYTIAVPGMKFFRARLAEMETGSVTVIARPNNTPSSGFTPQSPPVQLVALPNPQGLPLPPCNAVRQTGCQHQ